MMLLRNTLKVALGLTLVTTTLSAQQTLQTTDLSHSSVMLNEQALEKMGKLKVQEIVKSLKACKAQVFEHRSFISYFEAQKNLRPSVTRAGEAFSASYSMSPGIYNLVPGLPTGEYTEDNEPIYTGHGILGPIDTEVVYTNTSTGAENIEWLFRDTVYIVNEENVPIRYFPFQHEDDPNGFEKLPILTAYSVTGIEEKYQYGGEYNQTTGEFTTQGVINDQSTAFVWNCDPHTETFVNTFYAAFTDGWTQLAFGADSEYAASYIEFYEKPLAPIMISSTVFYVIAPPAANLTAKEFTVNWMCIKDIDGTAMWAPLMDPVTTNPSLAERFDDFSIWQVAVNTPEQAIVDEQFSIIIDGPQDGTGWALLHQVDRTSDKNTCGYIPTKGDYAGRVMTYTVSTDGSTYRTYNTSLDIYLGVSMPFTIMSTAYSMVYGDTLSIDAEGINENLDVVNWASLYFDEHDMKVESTAKDWLIATVTKQATAETLTYKVNLQAAPLPDGVAGRMADITFTDSRGFVKTKTFVQGDFEAAGVEETISLGALTAIVEGNNLLLTYAGGYTHVEVYTASGQLVASEALAETGHSTLAVGNLPKGMYLVKFVGEQTQTIKVVK